MIRRTIFGLLAACSLAACASPQAGAPPFPAADPAARGPFTAVNHQEGPDCTIFRPETLGEGGLKHPVILWGNGTGQRPAVYGQMLTWWATHGFVVAAANTTNAGTGEQMLACLDWLTGQDAAPGSPYFGHLDLTRVGTSGHSQGGGGAIMAGRDPRIDTTAPVQPYTRGLGYAPGAEASQHGPMLLLSGGADTIARIAPNQQPVFDRANVPVFWSTLDGAGHLVPMRGDSGEFRVIATAWFRAQLMDDAAAGTWFEGPACRICVSPLWAVQRRD